MATISEGYGKRSQDWSYLTARKVVHVQNGNVTDPTLLSSSETVDLTYDTGGRSRTSHGAERTLVIFAIPKAGATLTGQAELYLWVQADWETGLESSSVDLTSSSSSRTMSTGDVTDLDAADRWALIAVAKHTAASSGVVNHSLAFSFDWLPAGIYKAAIYNGATGEIIIAEQHTE